jgi:hypothetical protein
MHSENISPALFTVLRPLDVFNTRDRQWCSLFQPFFLTSSPQSLFSTSWPACFLIPSFYDFKISPHSLRHNLWQIFPPYLFEAHSPSLLFCAEVTSISSGLFPHSPIICFQDCATDCSLHIHSYNPTCYQNYQDGQSVEMVGPIVLATDILTTQQLDYFLSIFSFTNATTSYFRE